MASEGSNRDDLIRQLTDSLGGNVKMASALTSRLESVVGDLDDLPPAAMEDMLDMVQDAELPKTTGDQDIDDMWIEGLARSTEEIDAPPNDHLPDRETSTAVGRLRWEVFVSTDDDEDRLQIRPFLQMPKKRGGGFTVGRPVALQRLVARDPELPLDATDQKIASLIQRDEDDFYFYSSPSYHLVVFDALPHLIGSDRVTYHGQPAKIIAQMPRFRVVVRDDMLHLSAEHDVGESSIFVATDDILVIAPIQVTDSEDNPKSKSKASKSAAAATADPPVIAVASMPESLIQLHFDLLSAPPVDKSKRDRLISTLRPLQSRLSIVLPDSTDGPLRPMPSTLVVLLRSREDGGLDYGIRFRDAAGNLHLPAMGPQVQSIVHGEDRYQALRNGDDELHRATKLSERLSLHVDAYNRWFGSREDLPESLRLIADLQTLASEQTDHDDRIEILWDARGSRPITVGGTISRNNVQVEITKRRNWFAVGGTVRSGQTDLPLVDLLGRLMSEDDDAIVGDYVQLSDGHWAKIEDRLRDRLVSLRGAAHTDRGKWQIDATAAGEVLACSDDEIEIKSTAAWQKCVDRLTQSRTIDPVVPAGLDANLRDYQIDGFRWMSRLAHWGVGGVLADDMGLGKTLQTLAVLLSRSTEGPALVIAPTSVGFNWIREAGRFAPGLTMHAYRDAADRDALLQSAGPGDVVVCSYGLALRDAERLSPIAWHTLVLDEAQAIKNSRSKTSVAIANLSADWTIALTGTPVENHLGELWSLFHVVSPGVLGSWASFRDRYASPIEKDNDLDVRKQLARRLQPFVLRRTKSEVLTELPPRTEMNLYVDLSTIERQRYEEIRSQAVADIREVVKQTDIKDARFQILAAMTRLRQISCHVAMVDDKYDGPSAKLDCLIGTLQNLRSEGHRVLIFSQFVKHLTLIRDAMDQNAITYEYLDGSTAAAQRQEAVDRFQNGNADAFLISLKAGGTGLNLTAADYVIHMDPWWNPAVEDQATDRAHRMGQDKPVMVYRIVARDTIEQEILKMHDDKRDLASGVIEGTAAAAKLTNEDLIEMITTPHPAKTQSGEATVSRDAKRPGHQQQKEKDQD